MALVISIGLMAGSTKVNILKTRNRDRVSLTGQMVGSTLEPGSMVNSMEKEYMSTIKEKPSMAHGKKENALTGEKNKKTKTNRLHKN